ncbi:MAG: hypothetical protein MJ175_07735 [Clostridia bacterium]|nr:hypothetical protein [Clostridia bacterium]
MQFLKENSYNIVKCLLNQIAMMLFGLMLALAAWQNQTLPLCASLFSVACYLFLAYQMFWELGGKDRIRVDGGRAQPALWKGFAVSAIANIPNLILGILLVATHNAAMSNETAGNIYAVCNFLARGVEAMYLGLIQLYSPYNPIAFILIVFPVIVVAGAAYIIGHKNFRILGLFGIKPNLKDETR